MSTSSTKKRVLFFAPTPPPYMGPSIAAEIVLTSRFTQCFEVTHIDTADRRSLSHIGKIDLINICLPIKHFFQLIYRLLTKRIQVVYIPISQTALGYLKEVPLIVVSKLFGKKVVLHLHGGNFREFYDTTNKIMQWVLQKTLKSVQGMIVLGEMLKPMFAGLVDEEKIKVVSNGGDFSFRKREPKKKSESFKILFVANMLRTKGTREVLEAVKIVTQKYKNVTFKVVGEWLDQGERDFARQFIEENHLSSFICFTGTLTGKDKLDCFQESHLFIFPSYREGQPYVLIEALAAGLPIIATPVGAIAEMIQDGENGFLVPVKNAEILAEKIIYCIENPAALNEMGGKSRLTYENRYTEKHCVDQMIAVFEGL